jgi:hypothetical protein
MAVCLATVMRAAAADVLAAGLCETAVVFLSDVLHVTHDVSILIKPRPPRVPELIERAWQIIRLPDALVLLRQRVPAWEVALHHLAVECPRILDEHLNIGLFPLPEHLRRVGAVAIHETVGVDGHWLYSSRG